MRAIMLASAVRFSAGEASAQSDPGIGHNNPPAEKTPSPPKVKVFHAMLSSDAKDCDAKASRILSTIGLVTDELEQSKASYLAVLTAEHALFLRQEKADAVIETKTLKTWLDFRTVEPKPHLVGGNEVTIAKDLKLKSKGVMLSQLKGYAVKVARLCLDPQTSYRPEWIYRDKSSPTGFRFAELREGKYVVPPAPQPDMTKEQLAAWKAERDDKPFLCVVFDAWVQYPKLLSTDQVTKVDTWHERAKLVMDDFGKMVPNTLMLAPRHVNLANGLWIERTMARAPKSDEIIPKGEKGDKTKAGQGKTDPAATVVKITDATPFQVLENALHDLVDGPTVRLMAEQNTDKLLELITTLGMIAEKYVDPETNKLRLPKVTGGKRAVFNGTTGNWDYIPITDAKATDTTTGKVKTTGNIDKDSEAAIAKGAKVELAKKAS